MAIFGLLVEVGYFLCFTRQFKKFSVKSFYKTSHLTMDEVLNLFIQICRGINYVHDKHVIHRDLKVILVFRKSCFRTLDLAQQHTPSSRREDCQSRRFRHCEDNGPYFPADAHQRCHWCPCLSGDRTVSRRQIYNSCGYLGTWMYFVRDDSLRQTVRK